MSNRALVALSLFGLTLLAPSRVPVVAAFWSQPPAIPVGAAAHPVPADGMRIILLGTGTGPPVNLIQYGASTLIEAGGTRLLFDCGRGATMRLTEAGIPLSSVSRLFLTHLHSDHVMQIPDLLLTGWVVVRGRKTPLRGVGTSGYARHDGLTREGVRVRHPHAARYRREVRGRGITVRSQDIEPGVVFDERGVKVTAFLVDHGPVEPAFGYRVDYRGRSVVLSGDTRVSENLIRVAAGVDVLIHEAVDPVASRAGHGTERSPSRSLPTTRRASRRGKCSRGSSRGWPCSRTRRGPKPAGAGRQHYSGRLEAAEDLLVIDVAERSTCDGFRADRAGDGRVDSGPA